MKKILIDTQEKLPYSFNTDDFIVSRASLKTGDYILEDHAKGVVIERKSLEDWIKSIQEDRFYRELLRMQEFDMPLIIVESSIPQILEKKYNSPLPAGEIINRGINIIKDYKIPIIYCSDRQHAIYFVSQVFLNYTTSEKGIGLAAGQTLEGKKKRKRQKEEDIL